MQVTTLGDILGLGTPELLLILVILLLLFGATKLPKLARSIGQSAGELKKGLDEGTGDKSKSTESKDVDESKS
ncbi:TPA: twin-arginine translocase TatA/TatE family subunit [Candidatus Saccharibacteria bacterium]|nr:twin-arginine translocase TatA/TatE family subunit [Candidatus Saccharibacteria bacterium]HRF28957.1 twin-arginine translocase TatA/TatE family subunit [Candidatus Saccharibacteria bacterium]HRJ91390.1 twin-arginine translocase TatA/TatE family subunit [Candidatus Saccharibacteria bacterium]